MLDPHAKLNGSDLRDKIGTEQKVLLRMGDLAALQLASCGKNVAYGLLVLIVTM